MRVLITGGAGFLGHHVCDHLLRTTDWELVSLDRLDTSGNLNRLTDLECWEREKRRVTIIWHDLKAPISQSMSQRIGHVDLILHLAASTHVDRSILNPVETVYDNVIGTLNMLEYARQCDKLKVYYQQSTDEVYGAAAPGIFYQEWDRHRPGNPYSAAKSGADSLCVAYENTYKLPIIVGALMNLVGIRQLGEKFAPLCIRSILQGQTIMIHADPTCTIPGRRTYLPTVSAVDGIMFLLKHGVPGERYNIVGDKEVDNLSMAQMIADIIGKPLKYQLVSWHESRPGHELRYGLDGSKMREMGWKTPLTFEESLEDTVRWYLKNPNWL